MKYWKVILIVVLLAGCVVAGKFFCDFYLNSAAILMWLTLATGLTLFFLAILLPLIWLFQIKLQEAANNIASHKEYVETQGWKMIKRIRVLEKDVETMKKNIIIEHAQKIHLEDLRKQTLVLLCGENLDNYEPSPVFPSIDKLMNLLSLDDDVFKNLDFEDFSKYLRNTKFPSGKTAIANGITERVLLCLAEEYEEKTGKECTFLFQNRYPKRMIPDPRSKQGLIEFIDMNKCQDCRGQMICKYYPLYMEVVSRLKELEKAEGTSPAAPREPISTQDEALIALAEKHQSLKGEPLCMLLLDNNNIQAAYGGKTPKEASINVLKANGCDTCEASVLCPFYPTYIKHVCLLKKLEAEECGEKIKKYQEVIDHPSKRRMLLELKDILEYLKTRDCKLCYKVENCPLLKKKKKYEDTLAKMEKKRSSKPTPPAGNRGYTVSKEDDPPAMPDKCSEKLKNNSGLKDIEEYLSQISCVKCFSFSCMLLAKKKELEAAEKKEDQITDLPPNKE